MDEVECSVRSKGCEGCWEIVGRIYLKTHICWKSDLLAARRNGFISPGNPSVVFLLNVDDE